MFSLDSIARTAVVCAAVGWSGLAAGDELRNVKPGQEVPAYRMSTVDGQTLDSMSLRGKAVVLVYLSAEQRSSEQAAADSSEVFKKFKDEPVALVHVTADIVHKPSFERLRAEKGIEAPLGLDAGRKLYGDLGLIVFPTTILIDAEGRLSHVISTRSPDYPWILENSIRHTIGEINADQLAERLKQNAAEIGSPKSLAQRHRSAARLLREKGLFEPARAELVRAREFDPTDPNIMLDLADIDLSTGNPEEARSLAAEVLSTHDGHRRAQEVVGVALFMMNDIEAARATLTESQLLNPEPARGLYYLGRIAEIQGKPEEAMRFYRQAAEHRLGL